VRCVGINIADGGQTVARYLAETDGMDSRRGRSAVIDLVATVLADSAPALVQMLGKIRALDEVTRLTT
jgi:hypothetical protein